MQDLLSLCSSELFSPSQKYQLLVYHADSLFHDKEYRNAVSKYTMALQQKKALSKTSKVRPSTGNSASTPQSQVIKREQTHSFIHLVFLSWNSLCRPG